MKFDELKYNDTKKKILREIFSGEECTRGSLVESTGFSNLTISKIITEFLTDNIIIEEGSLASTGGRKPSTLKINPEYGYVLSIDIGTYSVKIGIVRFNGTILDTEKYLYYQNSIPVKTMSIDELESKISAIFDKYWKKRFIGIGVGISGMVDFNAGTIIFCPNITGYDNLHIKDILEEKFDIPVFLDTSARCMALAEQYFGCAQHSTNSMFLSLGFSIAAGIIIDSKIFRGASGLAGEIGHVQVKENDDNICTCGNYGCFELYATIPMIQNAIVKRLTEFSGYSPAKLMFPEIAQIDLKQIVQAYKKGDKIIEDVIIKTVDMIGSVIANSANVLNLDLIVLGGGLIEIFDHIDDEISRATMKHCLITVKKDLKIKRSTLGVNATVLGAAMQILRQLFY